MKYSDGKRPKAAAVVLCAGKGERAGLPYNKLLYHVGERTILELALKAFADTEMFDEILCVCSPDDLEEITGPAVDCGAKVCLGGQTRTGSVRNALARLAADTEIVLIHDGARPFVSRKTIENALSSAAAYGSGIPAVPVVDAVKVVENGEITASPAREGLYNVQTPQAFRFAEIADAYARIAGDYADDSEVYRLAGYKPRIVQGEYTNRKITTPADIFNLSSGYRVGFGYDVHRLVAGRDLILGGKYIPYEKGLLGHSDADVLVHAVMDALLSAAGLPDIGVLFPDTDPHYAGASSIRLLRRVRGLLAERNVRVLSLSCCVMAERPKLARHIPDMIANIAEALGIAPETVNISATTTEKLGIVGDGQGMAAGACALAGL